jgi:hypothetical protein
LISDLKGLVVCPKPHRAIDEDREVFGAELEPCEELRSFVSISDLKGPVVCPKPRRATWEPDETKVDGTR